MGISKLEAIALEVLCERGYDTQHLKTALALADLNAGSVEIVDDTLACALQGKRRDETLAMIPDPDVQGRIDRLASDCMVAQLAVQHTMS